MNDQARPLDPKALLTHLDWVRALARQLVRDASLADDVVQETVHAALARPPLVSSRLVEVAEERANVRGWLATVARHAAVNLQRSAGRRAARERSLGPPEAPPTPAELVQEAEAQRALVGHVVELDEPYRSAIVLRYFRGLNPGEIARVHSVPLNTVRARLARGLDELRARLDRTQGGRAAWLRAFAPIAAVTAAEGAGTVPSGSLVLAAALLVVVATGGAALWFTTTAAEPTLAESRGLDASAFDAAARGGAPAIETGSASSPREAAAVLEPRPRGKSTLVFQALDAESGEPLADLPFVVYCERRGKQAFAEGRTQADGSAVCRELPEDVFLIQTERRPPHAAGFRGVWVAKSTTERTEVLVDRGGSVRGRAVDDLGAPRAGTHVLLDGGAAAGVQVRGGGAGPDVIVATTDADGRFRVDALRAIPRGVWIVDGAERSESEGRTGLRIVDPRFAPWSGRVHGFVPRPGEELDLGDLVLPRVVELGGTVVDEGGAPLADVLVSADRDRQSQADRRWRDPSGAALPSDPAFALRAGETWTDAAGRFELVQALPELVAPELRLLAWTRSGARAVERVEAPAPGGRRDDVRLVVAERDLVVLDPVDESGARIELARARTSGDPFVQLTGTHSFASVAGWMRLGFGLADGRTLRYEGAQDVDGLVRIVLGADPAEALTLDVEVPGFAGKRIDLEPRLERGVARRVVLARLPVVRLQLSWRDGAWPDELEHLQLRACLLRLDPAAGPGLHQECCGLGSLAGLRAWSLPVTLELPVQSGEPVYVGAWGSGNAHELVEQEFGPFAPGAELHAVVLEPSVRARETHYEPEVPLPDGRKRARARLRLRVVDAASGEALDWSITAHPPDEDEHHPSAKWPQGGRDLEQDVEELPARAWCLHVYSDGHVPREAGHVTLAEGEERDLGTLALEPLPVRRGRLVRTDGGAWPDGATVSAGDAQGHAGDDGQFELRGEIEPGSVLRVSAQSWRHRLSARALPARDADEVPPPAGYAELPLGDWPPGEEPDLRIPPFRAVEVRVLGLPTTHATCTLMLGAGGTDRAFGTADDSVRFAPDGARLFRFVLGLGRYELRSSGRLHSIEPTPIEVVEGEGVQSIEVRVR